MISRALSSQLDEGWGWCVVPLPVAGERLAQPPSPENCTIREESRTTVRVSCAESEYFDANTATYVLQVFDADTRRLLASATSLTPSMLEVTDLPAERSQSGLVLSLRIMTAHAMSDATVLHSPHFVQEGNTNKEHHRYPGRAQIHSGSSYLPAPPPPLCPRPPLLSPWRCFCTSDVVAAIEREYENRFFSFLVQFKFFFSRPVTSWKKSAVAIARFRSKRLVLANDTFIRVPSTLSSILVLLSEFHMPFPNYAQDYQ